MNNKILNFKHLNEVNMGYFSHLKYGLILSTLSLTAGILGIFHSFLPFLFPFLPIYFIDTIQKYFDSNVINTINKEK